MTITNTFSEYSILIGECKKQFERDVQKEFILIIKPIFSPYFDHSMIHRITQSICSLLYPGIQNKNPGYETEIAISILNKPSDTAQHTERKFFQRHALVYGYIKDTTIVATDKKHLVSLDLDITFHISGGKVATSRMQVFPTKDKHLPLL